MTLSCRTCALLFSQFDRIWHRLLKFKLRNLEVGYFFCYLYLLKSVINSISNLTFTSLTDLLVRALFLAMNTYSSNLISRALILGDHRLMIFTPSCLVGGNGSGIIKEGQNLFVVRLWIQHKVVVWPFYVFLFNSYRLNLYEIFASLFLVRDEKRNTFGHIIQSCQTWLREVMINLM